MVTLGVLTMFLISFGCILKSMVSTLGWHSLVYHFNKMKMCEESKIEYLSKKLWISDKKAREFMSKMGKNMVLKIKNSEKA